MRRVRKGVTYVLLRETFAKIRSINIGTDGMVR